MIASHHITISLKIKSFMSIDLMNEDLRVIAFSNRLLRLGLIILGREIFFLVVLYLFFLNITY